MGSIFYKKLKNFCFDLLFPHFIFYFFGLGYCDVTIIPRLLCLQMLRYATYCFYIPCRVLSSKVEQSGTPYSCLYASSIYVTQGWLELCHTWPAVFSSIYVIRQLYLSCTVHTTKNLASLFVLPY